MGDRSFYQTIKENLWNDCGKDCSCNRRMSLGGTTAVRVNCEEYQALMKIKPWDRRLKLLEMRGTKDLRSTNGQ